MRIDNPEYILKAINRSVTIRKFIVLSDVNNFHNIELYIIYSIT